MSVQQPWRVWVIDGTGLLEHYDITTANRETQINLNKNRVPIFWNILFVYNAEKKNKEISTTALDSLFSSTTVPSPANRDPIVSSHLPKLRLLFTFRARKCQRWISMIETVVIKGFSNDIFEKEMNTQLQGP